MRNEYTVWEEYQLILVPKSANPYKQHQNQYVVQGIYVCVCMVGRLCPIDRLLAAAVFEQ